MGYRHIELDSIISTEVIAAIRVEQQIDMLLRQGMPCDAPELQEWYAAGDELRQQLSGETDHAAVEAVGKHLWLGRIMAQHPDDYTSTPDYTEYIVQANEMNSRIAHSGSVNCNIVRAVKHSLPKVVEQPSGKFTAFALTV